MINKELYEKLIEKYGAEHQLDMCIEEMSELTKEICKHKRGADNHNEIVEELCDVYITLEQLIFICDIKNDETLNMLNSKINRLKEMLEQ